MVFEAATQTHDAQFIREYLANNDKLPSVSISNVHRVLNPKASATSNSLRPPPIMFSIPDLKMNKLILQKLFETKGKVQFRNDVSKTTMRKYRNYVKNCTEDKQVVKII